MGFVITQSTTYVWPVSFEIPGEPGQFQKFTFDVEFHRLGQAKIEEIMAQINDGTLTDVPLCKLIVAGWNGITDGAQDVPFSVSALDKLLDFVGMAQSIIRAWMESLTGAKKKN